jgi:hypothetical protein
MSEDLQIQVNDQIVKLDNFINALQFLKESYERSLNDINVDAKMKEIADKTKDLAEAIVFSSEFQRNLVVRLGDDTYFVRQVCDRVKEQIDSGLASYFEMKFTEHIQRHISRTGS